MIKNLREKFEQMFIKNFKTKLAKENLEDVHIRLSFRDMQFALGPRGNVIGSLMRRREALGTFGGGTTHVLRVVKLEHTSIAPPRGHFPFELHDHLRDSC